MVDVGLADDHAGQKCAQGQRYAEQLEGGEGRAQGHGRHGQDEQLARAGVGDLGQQPGYGPRADEQHDGDEDGCLQQRPADAEQRIAALGRQHGHKHQDDDGRQILEHQPADGDTAVGRADQAAVGQAAQQHDGAGDGDRQAQHQPGGQRPAP